MKQRKILLLNPPGDRIYVRDYYCSKVSKAHYLYHPVDLLMLSGTLAQHHEIRLIDGMIEGWTHKSIIAAARSYEPDIIIFLTGIVSFEEDFQFIESLHKLFAFSSIASGELFLESPDTQLECTPFLGGAILDFTTKNIITLIERFEPGKGFKVGPPITNIVYRSGKQIVLGAVERSSGDFFEIPVPRHELFPNQNYRYPFVRRFPFATVLTDFGCPFNCQFCAMSKLGFKVRRVENVLKELDWVKTLGFKDIYFDDQTFGANRNRTVQLLEAMIERNYQFGFICFSRADVIDEELLRLMKRAGCHTIAMGVEASSDESLEEVGKGLTIHRIREAVSCCKTVDIRVVGTFVVGLPGMTREEAEGLGEFAADLGLDFASFNVPVPRPGTDLRRLAIDKGWITSDLMEMDQSGSYAVMGNEHMSAEEVLHYRNMASRRFYFRLGYMIHRALSIRTTHELKSHLREMVNLIHPKIFERRH